MSGELELGKRKSIFASNLYWSEELKSENDQVQLLMKKMSSCSVVVGMHPDQATEAIVDFALCENKPFAIAMLRFSSNVPEQKAKRRNTCKKFEQFVQYLIEKSREGEASSFRFYR